MNNTLYNHYTTTIPPLYKHYITIKSIKSTKFRWWCLHYFHMFFNDVPNSPTLRLVQASRTKGSKRERMCTTSRVEPLISGFLKFGWFISWKIMRISWKNMEDIQFLSHRASPIFIIHFERWHFPWHKPSSYLGFPQKTVDMVSRNGETPQAGWLLWGNIPFIYGWQLLLYRQPPTKATWKSPLKTPDRLTPNKLM